MTGFENVTCCEDIKRELSRICDVIADPKPYRAVHAPFPAGCCSTVLRVWERR